MDKSNKVSIMLSNILEARSQITKTRSILFEMGFRENDDIMELLEEVSNLLDVYSREIENI